MKLRIRWNDETATFEPGDYVTVGRMEGMSVIVYDELVSRSHLVFEFVDGEWRFSDSSSNGTFVDGSRVSEGRVGGAFDLQLGGVDGLTLTVDLAEVDSAVGSRSMPAPEVSPDAVGVAVSMAPPSVEPDVVSADPPPPAPVAEAPVEEVSIGPAPEPAPALGEVEPNVEAPVAPDSSIAPPSVEPDVVPADPPPPAPVAEAPVEEVSIGPAPEPAPAVGEVAAPSPPPPAPVVESPSGGVSEFDVNGPGNDVPGVVAGGAAVGAVGALAGAATPPPPAPVSEPEPVGSGTVRLDDKALRLELDGQQRVVQPGHRVVVGRGPDNDLRSESQLVSGTHCEFTHDGTNWWITDLGSTRGTFIDNRKVTKAKVEGAFFVLLGDDDAGAELRVVTAGEHRRPKDRKPLLLAGAALAIAVFGGIAAVLFWPDNSANLAQIEDLVGQLEEQQAQTDDQIAAATAAAEAAIAEANEAGGAGNSPSELSAARLSTAFISVPDGFGGIAGTGSGALVSDDGLVLTNIHVALPATQFERTGATEFDGFPDPAELFVVFPSEDGGPADLVFIAEQFATHPSHDAALLRIVEGIDGATLGDLPTPLSLGVSGELLAGEEVAVVGYPGTAFTDRVSVALSNFQSFQPCVAGSDFDVSFGCLASNDEGYLNLAGETLEGGSSGGPIVRGGEIVGIQLGSFGDPAAGSSQNFGVPIDLINDEFNLR